MTSIFSASLTLSNCDYRDTDESFVTVALHSQDLDTALKARAEEISNDIKDGYTGNLQFVCSAMDVPIPFLPVHGEDE